MTLIPPPNCKWKFPTALISQARAMRVTQPQRAGLFLQQTGLKQFTTALKTAREMFPQLIRQRSPWTPPLLTLLTLIPQATIPIQILKDQLSGGRQLRHRMQPQDFPNTNWEWTTETAGALRLIVFLLRGHQIFKVTCMSSTSMALTIRITPITIFPFTQSLRLHGDQITMMVNLKKEKEIGK